jgi:hypothetical protein
MKQAPAFDEETAPEEQFEHDVEPSREYSPKGQSMQVVAPTAARPAEQMRHSTAPEAVATLPEGHELQPEALDWGWKVPGTHDVQVGAAMLAHVPGAHGKQTREPATLNDPVEQFWQIVAPDIEAYDPPTHSVHAEEPASE